jgi:hypothetical protein
MLNVSNYFNYLIDRLHLFFLTPFLRINMEVLLWSSVSDVKIYFVIVVHCTFVGT